MFDYLSHPYLRWLRGRSEDDRPGINPDGLSPQALLQHTVNFPTPAPHVLLPPAALTGPADFTVRQPNEVVGFRVGMRDDVPGFNLNENGVLRPEREPPPESRDIAVTSTLPPGVEEPEPAPQIPQWLYNVLTMPVPQLSTAIDPASGRRIVPYEPLINWTRPSPAVEQAVGGTTDAGAYGPAIKAAPSPSSLEAPAIKQWASSDTPARPAVLDTRPDFPRPMMPETSWNARSHPLNDGEAGAQTSHIDARDPWPDVARPLPQQTPFPQEQQTQLRVPVLGADSAGMQRTPLVGASAIEHSVYSPDIDPGYDDLFDRVGVGDNKAKGDAARDVEAAKIKDANPNVAFAKEKRIYAEGVPGYTVADIVYRSNGTSAIIILEVKSGSATLSQQQLVTLAQAVRTGQVYLVNEEAAKKFGLRPYETFASKGIIPLVQISGGNQDAINRQLNKLGIETVPEKTRRGHAPRLRLIVRPL